MATWLKFSKTPFIYYVIILNNKPSYRYLKVFKQRWYVEQKWLWQEEIKD